MQQPASNTLFIAAQDAGRRNQISKIAVASGFAVVDSPDSAELAVVDFVDSAGIATFHQLRKKFNQSTLPIIAIVSATDAASLHRVGTFRVTDFICNSTMAEELPIRFRQARERHATECESRKRERDLSLLLQLTSDYASSLDIQEVLHDVTRRLAEEMAIDRAALMVIDESRDAGFIIAASDDAALTNLRIDLALYPEVKEVARTKKPVIVEDAPSHPLLEGVKVQVAARGIRTIAALPLVVQGKVLGVLLLRASGAKKAFSTQEIDFLSTVAHATAVALRNARLLESERGQTEKEKSARVAAERRAAQLERYESYFAHVSEGIAILDQNASVLSLNPAGAALLDISAVDARGRHINTLANPIEDGVLLEALFAVSKGEIRRAIDVSGRTVAGRRLTLSVSAAPLNEDVASVILSFRDVTAERELAIELSKTKDFLERLIDSSVDGIISADLKGNIILYNKGAQVICGWTPEEAVGKINVRDLYAGPTIAKEVMSRLRQGNGRVGVMRQEILTRSGQKVPVNITASIIYEGTREIATVGIFTDIRERMELEQQLSAAKNRLGEAEKNAVIVALAGTAAHELNQPLTSVMGYAELLRRKLNPDDYAFRPVDTIYREAERMAEIVRKIGKITRYETKSYIGTAKILDLDKASSHEE